MTLSACRDPRDGRVLDASQRYTLYLLHVASSGRVIRKGLNVSHEITRMERRQILKIQYSNLCDTKKYD